MSLLTLLAVAGAAGVGGLLGGLAPQLYRLLRRPALNQGSAPTASPWGGSLDHHLQRQVQDLSTAWAASRGHPEAAPLAHGYLSDAARDAEARWDRLR